jgi:hypothetical protein
MSVKKIFRGIKKAVKSVVGAVVDVVKSVVNFVGDVIGFVFNPFGAFDTPSVPDPGQEAQGVQVTKSGTNNAIPLIYGYRRTGGLIIFAESNGESNKYLYVVYAICEGEIEGVHKIIVNDVELPTVGTTHTAGQIYEPASGRFKGRMQYQIFNGTENQGQSSLANQTPNWPKKQRKLPGIAYAVFRFEWKKIESTEDADANPYSGGIPAVKFDVYGKKVYDVRTHGSGKDLVGSYSARTKYYSFNPANCLLDYLESTRYGAGLPANQIDAETFKIAANKYEQTVNYSNTQTGRALTMNAVVNTQQKVLDNVKTITAGCRGIMPFVQGRYKLKVEDGGNDTDISSTTINIAYDVTSDNIIGGISLDGERKSAKYNQVIVNYIDPDLGFTNQQIVYNVSGDQTIDNDEPLTGEFTFHTVTNPAIARDLAQMIYDKSRVQRTISFTGTQELLDVEIGDVIRITDTVLDLSLDTYRVVGLKLRNDGNVNVEAVEHDATLYPFTSGPQIEIPPQLFIPDDYTIVPYVRPLPEFPTSITPPLDPDEDSAGIPTESNPPANSPDTTVPTRPKITAFDDFSKTYTHPTTGAQVNYFNAANGTGQDFGWNGDGTNSVAQFTGPGGYAVNYPILNCVKYQNIIGPQYTFRLLMPLDTRINALMVRLYRNGNVFSEFDFPLTSNTGYGVFRDPVSGQRSRIDYYTKLRHPLEYFFTPFSEEYDYEVRWKDTLTGETWEDDSTFASFSSHTYTIAGVSKTGGNLEAFFNYLQYYHFNVQGTGTSTSKTTVVNLG